MADGAVLVARGLRREFGPRRVVAVQDVSFDVGRGRIVALLGPNGAGKTTTVRMCSTLLTPTSGTVHVGGVDAVASPRAARRQLGLVLGGERGFYLRATARSNLLFFADVQGVPARWRRQRVDEALAAVALTARADDRVEAYSRGMRQRLHIARALLSEPVLLLLDEPTTGLDPEIAHEVRLLVRRLADQGAGILLTTHHLTEAEQLADTVVLVVDGTVVVAGDAAEVARRSGVVAVTTMSLGLVPPALRTALELLPGAGSVDVQVRDGRSEVRLGWYAEPDADALWSTVAGPAGQVPEDLVTRRATLEESYLALVAGEQRRGTPARSPA